MSWALGRCCLVGQGALPLLSLKATEGPCGLCLQGSSREAGVIWVLHQEAAVAESVASCHSGICEKVKRPSGSSCSACFLESTSSRMCEHGQAAWRVLGGPGSEHGKPFSQPTRVCSVDYGILPYFHFSLSLLSCNCARFVLVSLSRPFCISSFLFIVASFHFFLILFFGSPLFIPPYLWKKKNPLHVSLFFLFSLFLFLSPNLLPFHSIGTREVVTQKNLSGLVPVRDLRLDPSLLCSIPLLALSPNLLIVWLFLSIAYLVAKLRCK